MVSWCACAHSMRTAHRAHFVFKTQNNINKFSVTTIADCKSTYTQWRHECISHIFTLHLLRLLPACHRMDICEIFIYIQHTSPLLIRLVSARAHDRFYSQAKSTKSQSSILLFLSDARTHIYLYICTIYCCLHIYTIVIICCPLSYVLLRTHNHTDTLNRPIKFLQNSFV